MANKKKNNRKASVPSKKTKAPAVIAGAAALTVAAVATVGAVYYVQDWHQVHRQWEVNLAEAEQKSSNIVSTIQGQLTTNHGSAKVFDANGGVLFTLRSTKGLEVLEEVPQAILAKVQASLIGNRTARPLNLDEYVSEQTKWGKLGGDDSNAIIDSSVGYKVLQVYAHQSQTMLSDELLVITASLLDQQLEASRLLSWAACNGEYGNISGLVNASEAWFNKPVNQLNEWQLEYMAYAYANPDASWEKFVETNSQSTGGATTPEEFGFFSTGGDPYYSLKQEVIEELESLEFSLEEENYNVQLAINPSLQADIQKAVDNGLKPSVTLDSVGNTAVDGSVLVVDSHTGMVTACVGSRSINTVARPFELAGDSTLGTMKIAEEMFEKDPTLSSNSLMKYDLASGEIAWDPFGDIVLTQQLGILGRVPEASQTVSAGDVADFLTGLLVATSDEMDNQVRYIREIQLSSKSETVYLAEQAQEVYTRSPELDMLGVLIDTPEDIRAPFALQLDNGVVWAQATTEYIVSGVFGTNSVGYTLTADDFDNCVTTASISVPGIVSKHYPKTPQKFDSLGTLAAKMDAARESNKEIVVKLANSYIKDLKEHKINSVGTRAAWEDKYLQYMNVIAGYSWTISTELADDLLAQLDAVRSERSSDLLKFVA